MRLLLIIFISLVLAGCSKHSEEPNPANRPGSGQQTGTNNPDGPVTDDNGIPVYDISQALTNSDSRFESPEMTFLYTAGGVIFEHDTNSRLRIIDLTSGHQILFDPAGRQLQIDGLNIELSYCAEAKRSGSTVWYNLTRTSDMQQIIIVDEISA